MVQTKKMPAGTQLPTGEARGVTVTTQLDYFTRTKRFRCPVHHGKNLSVSVGFIARSGLG